MLVEYGMDIIRADFHLHTKQDKKFKYEVRLCECDMPPVGFVKFFV